MHTVMSDANSIEEDRIRAAYAKRTGDTRYSWFAPGTLFIAHQCERRLLALLNKYGFADLTDRKVLEVGCGTGHWLREFVKWGARPENVVGIDLLPDRVAKARELCPQNVQIHSGSAAELSFAAETFDVVFQSTVFTSILDASLKKRIAAEMRRVVKRNGIILWYDYHVNNPWNQDVQGVPRREIMELFANCHIELQRMTLLPPLTRLLAPYSYLTCYLLQSIPLLCTHYLGVIRKDNS